MRYFFLGVVGHLLDPPVHTLLKRQGFEVALNIDSHNKSRLMSVKNQHGESVAINDTYMVKLHIRKSGNNCYTGKDLCHSSHKCNRSV